MGKASKLNLLSEGRGEHQPPRAHGQVARRRGRVIRMAARARFGGESTKMHFVFRANSRNRSQRSTG